MVTGSLQQKKGYYYAVLNIYTEDKKRKTKWISTGLPVNGNKRKAEELLIKFKNEYENGLTNIKVSPTPVVQYDEPKNIEDTYLFCDYMVNWLERLKYKIEINTYISYKYNIHGKMYRYFSETKITLTQLKARHLQQFYDYLLSLGLTVNTVKHYHTNIYKALQQAVIDEYIPFNPADRIESMKIKQYNAKYYSQDELEAVIEVFKKTPVKIPVLISMLYGFRRSEVLGLKWDSIDLKNKSITVKKTVCRGNLDGEVKFLIKDRTKTKAGLRTLPLIPLAEKILLEEFERQQSQKNRKY